MDLIVRLGGCDGKLFSLLGRAARLLCARFLQFCWIARASAAVALAAGLGTAAHAQAKPMHLRESNAQRALLAAEDSRFRAMVAADGAALQRDVADELTFGHRTGKLEDKRRFIADIVTGKVGYRAIAVHGRTATVSGRFGVIRGIVDMDVGERHLIDGYIAVYVLRGGRWQILEWQSYPSLASADER